MKAHFGMRPHDIVILLKILSIGTHHWQYRDLAADLRISISEIAESLNRSHIAGLVDESRRRVNRRSLLEFVEYGLHCVFPAVPGTFVTGVPTAHSQTNFKSKFASEIDYVWPNENGLARGLAITPLHKEVPVAVQKDQILHRWLAAVDIIRVGKTRELKAAVAVLQHDIKR